MSRRDDDRSWEVYTEETVVGPCKCGQGKIIDIDEVASHNKVPKIEREFLERVVRCKNPNCPSKNK